MTWCSPSRGTVKDNLSSKLGTQEIRVGKSHIVKTTLFELEGGRHHQL